MKSKFTITKDHSFEDNPFDRQERISWWDQKKIKEAVVLVVGAGAIGNETLKNLILLGFRNILLADFDEISTSNLSRTILFRKEDIGKRKTEVAAERLKEMALDPETCIDAFDGDIVWELGHGVYRRVDLVLGCLDNIETRFAVNRNCMLAKVPWIDAGISELALRVNFYNCPQTPCYQCSASPSQWLAARQRYSCDDFKKKVTQEDKIATVQISSAIVAALQVQEAVKYLCGQEVSAGKQLYFQGLTNDFDTFGIEANPECLAHASYPEVHTVPLSAAMSVKEVLEYLENHPSGGEGCAIDLRGDRTFVHSISCRNCRREIIFKKPTFRIYEHETLCSECSKNGSQSSVSEAIETPKKTIPEFSLKNTATDLLHLRLCDIGIPYLHVISVKRSDQQYAYFELSADEDRVFPSILSKK